MSMFKTGDAITNSNQIRHLPAHTEFKDVDNEVLYYMSGNQVERYLTAYLPEGARYSIPLQDIPSDVSYEVPLRILHVA